MAGWGVALGGGGPVGAGWYAGLADGLLGGGPDLREASIVVVHQLEPLPVRG